MRKRALASRTTGVRPTAINRVLAEVREMEKAGRAPVSLMRGQPDLPTPAHVVEAAERALRSGRTGYPNNQGEPGLRAAIAEKIARAQGVSYDADAEVLVTDGATCGVAVALAALVEPGAEVLAPSPIYDAYESVIQLWGGSAVRVECAIRDGRFVIDRRALEASCTTRTRVLLLNSPWNPVGTVLRAEELETIASFAQDRDLWIISDEIYEALVYDDARHVSVATVTEDARSRTILVNSLSKTYAMTGWRIGYCAGPAEVVRSMALILQQYSRGPATFVQDAAACALRSDQTCVAKMVAEYQRRRNLVLDRLQGIAGCAPLRPEGGLFVMLDVRGLGKSSEEARRFLLTEMGVVVVDGAAFGPGGDGMLRVSFAAGGSSLETGLQRLRDGLEQL